MFLAEILYYPLFYVPFITFVCVSWNKQPCQCGPFIPTYVYEPGALVCSEWNRLHNYIFICVTTSMINSAMYINM